MHIFYNEPLTGKQSLLMTVLLMDNEILMAFGDRWFDFYVFVCPTLKLYRNKLCVQHEYNAVTN